MGLVRGRLSTVLKNVFMKPTMKPLNKQSHTPAVPLRSGLGQMKNLAAAVICILGLLPLIHATQPVVAIHDSELTRALESMPASGACRRQLRQFRNHRVG